MFTIASRIKILSVRFGIEYRIDRHALHPDRTIGKLNQVIQKSIRRLLRDKLFLLNFLLLPKRLIQNRFNMIINNSHIPFSLILEKLKERPRLSDSMTEGNCY
jgi:hypothetical protein